MVLIPREPRGGVVSCCRYLLLVPGAGIVQEDLLHRVWASCTGSRGHLPMESRLDHLLVGFSRVVVAIWHVVIRTSRTIVVIVPLSVRGRVERQHLYARWVSLRFKQMELPRSERPGEVLGVTGGGEGQGLSSCLRPRTSWGWESYPVSVVGRSGAARFLWG